MNAIEDKSQTRRPGRLVARTAAGVTTSTVLAGKPSPSVENGGELVRVTLPPAFRGERRDTLRKLKVKS